MIDQVVFMVVVWGVAALHCSTVEANRLGGYQPRRGEKRRGGEVELEVEVRGEKTAVQSRTKPPPTFFLPPPPSPPLNLLLPPLAAVFFGCFMQNGLCLRAVA